MPNVNGMKFPYTPAGKMAAKKASEKMSPMMPAKKMASDRTAAKKAAVAMKTGTKKKSPGMKPMSYGM